MRGLRGPECGVGKLAGIRVRFVTLIRYAGRAPDSCVWTARVPRFSFETCNFCQQLECTSSRLVVLAFHSHSVQDQLRQHRDHGASASADFCTIPLSPERISTSPGHLRSWGICTDISMATYG